ncbi:MAG: cyclic nucleotide-binding protein [Sphingobacteriales bacterium 50-39]|nr:Crp/Fnr family transcriptional regulator [Sphingobacteriales bacterium]OJW58483.1 MAG: cyclic nucleotide-binding protein [Sphingobacteriales bacterium 50-39]
MFELLYKKITEKISLSEEEFEVCKTLFTSRKVRKRQFMLQEGDVSRYQIFVNKGLLRSYTIDEKGTEHILQFALEGWWTADLYSFFTEEPSLFNIEALEDSEVLLITRPSWETLLEKLPVLERYFRILIQNSLIATQRRLMESLSETAEKKYLKFMKMYPESIQRVPQHMIASYLGITRETLSRLRRDIATGGSGA